VDQVHASENTMPLTQRILGKAHISTNRVNTYSMHFSFFIYISYNPISICKQLYNIAR